MTLLILSPIGLGTRSAACNIFVVRCFDPNIIMIMTPKLIVKLKFGFGIMS
jgi:hypothetical protein